MRSRYDEQFKHNTSESIYYLVSLSFFNIDKHPPACFSYTSLYLSTFTYTLINTPDSYRDGGDGCDKRVDEHRGDLAGVVRTRVGLREGLVVAEEALDVYGEGVRVLKVVSQQNRPSHDHQLEIEHYPSVRKREDER